MQRTKSKLLSILLSLVMLLSLLPTTALAAGSASTVELYYGNGSTTSLSNGECLATNTDTSETSYTSGDPYVARYDSGTLYLDGYNVTDVKIFADGDLNIEVVSASSFSTSVSASNDLYGIQANGKLNISGSGKLTVTANGNGNVYGIYANEGVTISAPLVVNVGKVDSSQNGPLYGIYTKSGAISLSGNDMTVTATVAKENVYGVYNAADASTASTDNGNITIRGKLTVSLSNGSYNRGISSQGGVITLDGATVKIPGNYYYGIFNKNGNVDIKNNSDVDISSDISSNIGIHNTDGNLNIEDSTVKVSAKGYAADPEKGKLSIKDSIVDLTRDDNHYRVVNTANDAANTIDLSGSGSGSVTLTASGNQSGNSMIGGTVSITTPGTKLEKGKHYPGLGTYDGEYDTASDKTVLKFVHDAPALTANISLSQTSTMDFGSIEAGYSTAPAAQTVTITNNGTAATGALTIALDGANKTDFTLSKNSITDIAASGTDTFTVQPKTGLSAGNYTATVKVSGAGVTERSFNVQVTVTAPLTAIDVPVANTSLVYDGTEQTGVNESAGYTLTDTYKATNVGATDYVATATLETGYKWKDGTTDAKTIHWNISKRTPTVADFTFAPPAELTYDGSDKTASVTLKSPLKNSGAITPTYMKDGAVVTETKNVGTYTVKIDVADGDNFTAGHNLTDSTSWTFSIIPANQNAPTGLGVAAPITSGGKGKITGTTDKMEYSTDSSFASPTGTTCTDTATEVAPGTYHVRLKADSNHNAGAAATVTVPAYSATPYSITVNNDGHGIASADKTSAVAGETITLTATPNSGYVFDKWDDKVPTSLIIGTDGKFYMPGENVSVKATFKPAALTGTASITGDLKYGAELTASPAGTNNTGTLTYKWYRSGEATEIATNTTGKYTLVAADIGKTITVKITSSVQAGEITGTTTGTIDKADGPAAPTAFTLTFTLNSDGTTFTATIPAFAGGEYSFDGATYSPTASTKSDCNPNTSYTGYARIAETSTHKASAPTSSTQTSPKLTVATPTFTPNGASGFTGTQSVTISCTTAGAKIYYTTDGTTPTASSTEYTTSLSLSSTTTVKAIAVNAGMNDSAIATATFTKYSGGGGSSSGGGGGSYSPSYSITPGKSENGSITVSPKSARKGDTVTITVTPDKGYELEDLTVLDSKGKELALTEKNGKYSFKMPAGKVEVKATFIKEAEISPFDDVSTNAYYYEAVKWAQEKGITGGIGNKLFGPNDPCTRAQIVTFLWRAAGSPAPKNTGTAFGDVKPGSFYEQAVAWAVENGITGGTSDGMFSPDATCTRAQSVTFLYRAAGSPAVSGSAEFGDVATNAYYADAVAWAAKNGITGGIGGGQFGSGNDCTRGQIVTFLYRAYNK